MNARDQSYGSPTEFRDRYAASSGRRRLHRHASPLPLVADRADVCRPGGCRGGRVPLAGHVRIDGGDAHHAAADFRPPGADRGQYADAAASGADAAGNPQPRQSDRVDPAAVAGSLPERAAALSDGRHRAGYAQQSHPAEYGGPGRPRRLGVHHLLLLPGPVQGAGGGSRTGDQVHGAERAGAAQPGATDHAVSERRDEAGQGPDGQPGTGAHEIQDREYGPPAGAVPGQRGAVEYVPDDGVAGQRKPEPPAATETAARNPAPKQQHQPQLLQFPYGGPGGGGRPGAGPQRDAEPAQSEDHESAVGDRRAAGAVDRRTTPRSSGPRRAWQLSRRSARKPRRKTWKDRLPRRRAGRPSSG